MRWILGAVIWLIAGILLAIPLGVLAIVKLIVLRIYGGRRLVGGNGEGATATLVPLTALDSLMAFDGSWERPAVNVAFVMQLEGNIEISKLRERFEECFDLNKDSHDDKEEYDKLWSYLVKKGGYIFRARLEEKGRLDLEEQIVERFLEDGGTLEEFMGKWIMEFYQRECSPCWQIAVIRQMDKAKKITCVAFKIHHALADGYSTLHILDKLTGQKSPYLVKDHKHKGFIMEAKQFLEGPLNMAGGGGPMQGTVDSTTFKVSLPRTPEGGARVRGLYWMYSFTSLSLEEMRSLRRRGSGVHMMSVIWTVIGGALRRFLESQEFETDKLPELIDVGCSLPVPRHPAMVEDKRRKDKLCNHWVSAVLKVPIEEPDPEIRLNVIEGQLKWILDNGLDKILNGVVPGLVWTAPACFLDKMMGSREFKGPSAFLSSMVGAEETYELLGCPVKNIHWCLAALDTVPTVPLSCFTFSHGGKMELTLAANPHSIFRDKETLDKICKKFVHEEIEEFLMVGNSSPVTWPKDR